MVQELAITIFQWKPLSLGDIGTVAVAVATVITLIVSVRLASKSYRLTVTQINREDKAKVYATALAGLRAMFVAEAWNIIETVNKIIETKELGSQIAALNLLEVFGSGNEIVLYRKPDDDSNIAEIKSIEFQAKVDLIGSVEVSVAFKTCIQKYRKYSKDLNVQFWNIKEKETKEDLDSIRTGSFQKLSEINKLVRT